MESQGHSLVPGHLIVLNWWSFTSSPGVGGTGTYLLEWPVYQPTGATVPYGLTWLVHERV